MKEKPVEFSIKVEPGDVDSPLGLLRKGVEDLRKALPYQVELQEMLASVTKAKFDSLIQEGFSEQQALFLCK